jgi:hypothetical protein
VLLRTSAATSPSTIPAVAMMPSLASITSSREARGESRNTSLLDEVDDRVVAVVEPQVVVEDLDGRA